MSSSAKSMPASSAAISAISCCFVGFIEKGDYGFVEGFSCGVKDFSEAGLRWGQGMAEFQEGFRDGAGGGAGEADYADAAAAGWGGDGDDGVFELGHGEAGHLGFL